VPRGIVCTRHGSVDGWKKRKVTSNRGQEGKCTVHDTTDTDHMQNTHKWVKKRWGWYSNDDISEPQGRKTKHKCPSKKGEPLGKMSVNKTECSEEGRNTRKVLNY